MQFPKLDIVASCNPLWMIQPIRVEVPHGKDTR